MEVKECSNTKLILVNYRVNKVEDIVPGSLALVRSDNFFFFINNNLIDAQKQLFNHFGRFHLNTDNGYEFLKMFLIINPDKERVKISAGELCAIETRPNEYPGEYDLVHYQMPDYDSIKPWKTSDMIVYKIMATTEQIANALVQRPSFSTNNLHEEESRIEYCITTDTILEIFGEDSHCFIDVEKIDGFYQPKLKEGKLVICL